VKEGVRYLGVSPQKLCIFGFERRKQFPIIRVNGVETSAFLEKNRILENIPRFFKNRKMENALDSRKNMMVFLFRKKGTPFLVDRMATRKRRARRRGIHIHARLGREAQRLLRERLQAEIPNDWMFNTEKREK